MDAFDDLKMAYPRSDPERLKELHAIGRQLKRAD
jgi:hypothetical protein